MTVAELINILTGACEVAEVPEDEMKVEYLKFGPNEINGYAIDFEDNVIQLYE